MHTYERLLVENHRQLVCVGMCGELVVLGKEARNPLGNASYDSDCPQWTGEKHRAGAFCRECGPQLFVPSIYTSTEGGRKCQRNADTNIAWGFAHGHPPPVPPP